MSFGSRVYKIARSPIDLGAQALDLIFDGVVRLPEEQFDVIDSFWESWRDNIMGQESKSGTGEKSVLGSAFGPEGVIGSMVGALPTEGNAGILRREGGKLLWDPMMQSLQYSYKNFVDRPIGTLATLYNIGLAENNKFYKDNPQYAGLSGLNPLMMLDEVKNRVGDGAFDSRLYDISTYTDVWNISESRSAGQAIILALRSTNILDPEELEQEMGTQWYQIGSGIIDFNLNIVGDPAFLVAKGMRAGYANKLAKQQYAQTGTYDLNVLKGRSPFSPFLYKDDIVRPGRRGKPDRVINRDALFWEKWDYNPQWEKRITPATIDEAITSPGFVTYKQTVQNIGYRLLGELTPEARGDIDPNYLTSSELPYDSSSMENPLLELNNGLPTPQRPVLTSVTNNLLSAEESFSIKKNDLIQLWNNILTYERETKFPGTFDTPTGGVFEVNIKSLSDNDLFNGIPTEWMDSLYAATDALFERTQKLDTELNALQQHKVVVDEYKDYLNTFFDDADARVSDFDNERFTLNPDDIFLDDTIQKLSEEVDIATFQEDALNKIFDELLVQQDIRNDFLSTLAGDSEIQYLLNESPRRILTPEGYVDAPTSTPTERFTKQLAMKILQAGRKGELGPGWKNWDMRDAWVYSQQVARMWNVGDVTSASWLPFDNYMRLRLNSPEAVAVFEQQARVLSNILFVNDMTPTNPIPPKGLVALNNLITLNRNIRYWEDVASGRMQHEQSTASGPIIISETVGKEIAKQNLVYLKEYKIVMETDNPKFFDSIEAIIKDELNVIQGKAAQGFDETFSPDNQNVYIDNQESGMTTRPPEPGTFEYDAAIDELHGLSKIPWNAILALRETYLQKLMAPYDLTRGIGLVDPPNRLKHGLEGYEHITDMAVAEILRTSHIPILPQNMLPYLGPENRLGFKARTFFEKSEFVSTRLNSRAARITVEKVPQGIANWHQPDHALVQVERMLRDVSRISGIDGIPILEKAGLNANDVMIEFLDKTTSITDMVKHYDIIVNKLVEALVDTFADMPHPIKNPQGLENGAKIVDKQQVIEILRGDLTSAQEILVKAADEGLAKEASFGNVDYTTVVVNEDGQTLSRNIAISPSQMRDSSVVPRFDMYQRLVKAIVGDYKTVLDTAPDGTITKRLVHIGSSRATVRNARRLATTYWKKSVLLTPRWQMVVNIDSLLRTVATVGAAATIGRIGDRVDTLRSRWLTKAGVDVDAIVEKKLYRTLQDIELADDASPTLNSFDRIEIESRQIGEKITALSNVNSVQELFDVIDFDRLPPGGSSMVRDLNRYEASPVDLGDRMDGADYGVDGFDVSDFDYAGMTGEDIVLDFIEIMSIDDFVFYNTRFREIPVEDLTAMSGSDLSSMSNRQLIEQYNRTILEFNEQPSYIEFEIVNRAATQIDPIADWFIETRPNSQWSGQASLMDAAGYLEDLFPNQNWNEPLSFPDEGIGRSFERPSYRDPELSRDAGVPGRALEDIDYEVSIEEVMSEMFDEEFFETLRAASENIELAKTLPPGDQKSILIANIRSTWVEIAMKQMETNTRNHEYYRVRQEMFYRIAQDLQSDADSYFNVLSNDEAKLAKEAVTSRYASDQGFKNALEVSSDFSSIQKAISEEKGSTFKSSVDDSFVSETPPNELFASNLEQNLRQLETTGMSTQNMFVSSVNWYNRQHNNGVPGYELSYQELVENVINEEYAKGRKRRRIGLSTGLGLFFAGPAGGLAGAAAYNKYSRKSLAIAAQKQIADSYGQQLLLEAHDMIQRMEDFEVAVMERRTYDLEAMSQGTIKDVGDNPEIIEAYGDARPLPISREDWPILYQSLDEDLLDDFVARQADDIETFELREVGGNQFVPRSKEEIQLLLIRMSEELDIADWLAARAKDRKEAAKLLATRAELVTDHQKNVVAQFKSETPETAGRFEQAAKILGDAGYGTAHVGDINLGNPWGDTPQVQKINERVNSANATKRHIWQDQNAVQRESERYAGSYQYDYNVPQETAGFKLAWNDFMARHAGPSGVAGVSANRDFWRQFWLGKSSEEVIEWLRTDGKKVLDDLPEEYRTLEGIEDLERKTRWESESLIPNTAEFAKVRLKLAQGNEVKWDVDIQPIIDSVQKSQDILLNTIIRLDPVNADISNFSTLYVEDPQLGLLVQSYYRDTGGTANLIVAAEIVKAMPPMQRRREIADLRPDQFGEVPEGFLLENGAIDFGKTVTDSSFLDGQQTTSNIKRIKESVDSILDNAFENLTMVEDIVSRGTLFESLYEAQMAMELQPFRNSDGTYRLDGEDIENLRARSRRRAIKETKMVLYDLAERSRFEEVMQEISPFLGAWTEVTSRWIGIAADNPVFVARALRSWAMLTAEDENRNSILVFQMPGVLDAEVFGRKVFGNISMLSKQKIDLNLKSAAMLGSLPTFGPIVSYLFTEVALEAPEVMETLGWVVPYGLAEGPNPLARLADSFSPSWPKALTAKFGMDQSGRAKTRVKITQDYLAELWVNGQEVPSSGLEMDEFVKEVDRRTSMVYGIKLMRSLTIPIAIKQQSPYWGTISEYWRKQDEIGLEEADDWLLENHPELWSFTGRITANKGVIAGTLVGHQNYKKHKEIANRHPVLGGFITGQDGAVDVQFERNEAVMQIERNRGNREYLPPEGILTLAAEKIGWREYGVFRESIDSRLRLKALSGGSASLNAKDNYAESRALKQFVKELGKENSQWLTEYNDLGNISKQQQILQGFRDVVDSGDFDYRVELPYIEMFINLHDSIARQMILRARVRNNNSYLLLSYKGNEDLEQRWAVGTLKIREYPDFSNIYDVYFSNMSSVSTGNLTQSLVSIGA